jgi:hypothetical protein
MKNFILRWLGLPTTVNSDYPQATALVASRADDSGLTEGMQQRTHIEIVTAVNGKIIVATRHINNPTGLDRFHKELYLVRDDSADDLMGTIGMAVVSLGLQQ